MLTGPIIMLTTLSEVGILLFQVSNCPKNRNKGDACMRERGDEIIGQTVRVKRCEAREHGCNSQCVCDFVGDEVVIKEKYDRNEAPMTKPSYHIWGSDKRVLRSEVVLPRKR